jgi:hypothetical protein
VNLRNSLIAAMLLSMATSVSQVNARTIVDRSLQAIAADLKAAPDYECLERDREPGGGKTFQDLMILGSPYQRLTAVNGKPISGRELDEEQRKLEETIEKRRHESVQERRNRIARYQKSRDRNHLFLEEMTKAFNFRVVGQQPLGGREVYVLKAVPLPDYHPPNRDAEVLKGMQGTLWIDKKTYQWVKVQARVTRPVSIEGFVAKVEPGTRFELDKMPVEDDVWLPERFVMKARAKVFFLFNHNNGEDDTYYDYRKIAPNQDSFVSK